jgi:hypothetical protein
MLLGGATLLTIFVVVMMIADLRFQHKRKSDIVKQIRKRRKEVLLIKQKKKG